MSNAHYSMATEDGVTPAGPSRFVTAYQRCNDCGWRGSRGAPSAEAATKRVRRHVAQTGHTAEVALMRTYRYKPGPKR